ncbi:MAG: NifU family protein [Armatimonadota bacterium]
MVGEEQRDAAAAAPDASDEILKISEVAATKILDVMRSQDPPVFTLRVSSPARGKYAMNLEPEGTPAADDTTLEYDGFQVYVDSDSLEAVRGASLDFVMTPTGGGFQFTNPNDAPRGGAPQRKEAPEGPEGDVWRQIQQVLEAEVNPAVASHGGRIDLIEYKEGIAYVQMSGGCQGCGMAAMTLKQGVEQILRSHVPEIDEILDVTDHAGGRNPYYASSTK